jgi:predicted RNA-binding Zn ribbon-like protein
MANQVIPAPETDACLAFANTRYWRGTATPAEELGTVGDLLRWAEKVERLPPALLCRFASADSTGAGGIFDEAIGLRETIHRCFTATASGQSPDVAALNAALAEAPARQLVGSGGWEIEAPGATVGVLLAPVLWSAADLLVGRQLMRVRSCANPACGWLFLDDSKSGNRRWCSMSACGNRAKAHRHYLRQKGT